MQGLSRAAAGGPACVWALPGGDASTADAAPGRVERDEQGEARRANTTPNGGPHLERGRLRLKTWSKSDFSIAETTWQTYLHIPRRLQG